MEIAPNLIPPALGPAPETAGPADSQQNAAADQDFDSFLRLLTAQLRNQDPLQPIDSTEFVAQLASFSSVEQLIQANETLERMVSDTERTALAGWIGLEAGTEARAFAAAGEPIAFSTPALPGAEAAVLAIRAADGTVLREIPLDPAVAERITWDGLDSGGQPVLASGLSAEVIGVAGGELTVQEPATLLREVASVRIAGEDQRLVFADGSTLAPDRVTVLGQLPEPEAEGEAAG